MKPRNSIKTISLMSGNLATVADIGAKKVSFSFINKRRMKKVDEDTPVPTP